MRTYPQAQRRSKGRLLVRRYVADLARWHQQVAFLRARLEGLQSTHHEREEALRQLSALSREAQEAYDDFRTDVGSADSEPVEAAASAFRALTALLAGVLVEANTSGPARH
jgi:hypothetical protein